MPGSPSAPYPLTTRVAPRSRSIPDTSPGWSQPTQRASEPRTRTMTARIHVPAACRPPVGPQSLAAVLNSARWEGRRSFSARTGRDMTVIAPALALALLSLTVVIDLRSTERTCGIRALMARRGRGRSVTPSAMVPDTGYAEHVARDAAVTDKCGAAVRNSSQPGGTRAGSESANRTCRLPRRGRKCEPLQRSAVTAGRRSTAPFCAGGLGGAAESLRSCERTPRYGPR